MYALNKTDFKIFFMIYLIFCREKRWNYFLNILKNRHPSNFVFGNVIVYMCF